MVNMTNTIFIVFEILRSIRFLSKIDNHLFVKLKGWLKRSKIILLLMLKDFIETRIVKEPSLPGILQ